MSEPLTVADLTEEHIGFYMQIEVDPRPEDLFPMYHRSLELGDIRRWEYPVGTPRIGLVDVSTRREGIAGTEYSFRGSAKVTLIRQVRKPRRSRKRQT